ncbi:heme-binding protein [Chitinophagales bacterium]|nr:heme-binding protein [Chitinophagales bacterium]
MKIILVSVSVILLGFLAVQAYAMSTSRNIESYPYTVIQEYGDFEIRQYEASLFTSVTMSTDKYEEASGKGFSALAGYIFGGNERNEKIAMTSPVAMSLEDSMTMMFLVPKAYKKEDLPKPNTESITITEMPAKKVAAITFGGWADSEKIVQYQAELRKALDREGIAYTNKSYFLGYNPPFEMVGRKNEVIIELK